MALLCLAVLPTPLGRHSWLAGAASQNCGSDFIQPLGISIGFIYLGRREGNGGSENREKDWGCALKTETLFSEMKVEGSR